MLNTNKSFLEDFKENLKIKRSPKTQKEFFFQITEEDDDNDVDDDKKPQSSEETKTEEQEEKEDEVVPTQAIQRHMVTIIDQTKTSRINRDLILKRIQEAKKSKVFPSAEVVSSSDIVEDLTLEPAPKKIIIRPGKKRIIIKAPEPEIEVTETEVTKESPKVLPKPKLKIKIVSKLPIKEAMIDDRRVTERLPKHPKAIRRVSQYYMNNRKIFIEKIAKLFEPERREYNEKKETVSCDSTGNADFELLPHQKIAQEYLNLYTPYRGLLLYFSLGSGKSCTSIAIAEGMKTDKHIFVMTPASLKINFFTELKKCGDPIFKKNQYWEFVTTVGHANYTDILSTALSLPKDYIEKYKGAWLVDIHQPANFSELSGSQQKEIDEQLNEMIRSKYTDLNYNGLNMRKLRELTEDFTKNPFDHSVIIIDEAHNFVSRIVNKIKKKKSISYMLYDLLMKATDVRIVLLSGTPIINYPNEIGILYNILRGYIKTWTFQISVKTNQKINKETILEMFQKHHLNTYDYVEYSGNKLIITRNPFGFINTKKPGPSRGEPKRGGSKKITKKNIKKPHSYTRKQQTKETKELDKLDTTDEYSEQIQEEIDQSNQGNRVPGLDYDKLPLVNGGSVFEKYHGVRLDESGNMSDEDFIRTIVRILKQEGLDVIESATEVALNKALPDDSESFLNIFIDQDEAALKNKELFQRRILGLTSYYRSAQEQLLPNFVETTMDDKPSVFHLEEVEMSEYQFKNYSEIRKEERDQERKNKIKSKQKRGAEEEDLYKISSTYRIFSRACCNFVFPNPPGRPMPSKPEEVVTEAKLDATPAKLLQSVDEYAGNDDEESVAEEDTPVEYSQKIEAAMTFLKEHSDEYLSLSGLAIYSPKFRRILENLQNRENHGLHLLYSQFRTIEGIGILQIVLEANGFEQLVIYKNDASGEWTLQEPRDPKKPRFMLYTGTETPEERDILLNIYNSQWDVLPPAMTEQLRAISDNNYMGDIVKIIMITASGAEGINLKNTRFVHIVEPYWHMVRLEQVIGRARRICSHQKLPEEMRTVKVFLYISIFTEEQSTSETNKELIINDVSKLDKKTPLTTDESLYETARIKDTINQQILTSIKESAIDCGVYGSNNAKENLVCYGYGKITSNNFGSFPTLEEDVQQKTTLNVKKEKLKLRKATVQGKDYAYDSLSGILYDFESYQRSKQTGENLQVVGKLTKKGRNLVIEPVLE